jgi:hypothetical protein
VTFEPSYRHLGLVPQRYHRNSGLTTARFHVRDARGGPFVHLRKPEQGQVRISPSAYCEFDVDADTFFALFAIDKFPTLAASVSYFAQGLTRGNRAQRYTTLFKAYESLQTAPDITLSAVRHGLSHSTTALSRPKTVAALRSLFGTTHIDLDRADHSRIFFRQLVALLIETDRLLAQNLADALARLRRVESVLADEWWLKGVPGIYGPLSVLTNESS